jgi:hypothetical protein
MRDISALCSRGCCFHSVIRGTALTAWESNVVCNIERTLPSPEVVTVTLNGLRTWSLPCDATNSWKLSI